MTRSSCMDSDTRGVQKVLATSLPNHQASFKSSGSYARVERHVLGENVSWVGGIKCSLRAVPGGGTYPPFTLCLKMVPSLGTDWRFNVFMRLKLGEDERQIQADLSQVVGRDCPSYCTVARWISSFKDERQSF